MVESYAGTLSSELGHGTSVFSFDLGSSILPSVGWAPDAARAREKFVNSVCHHQYALLLAKSHECVIPSSKIDTAFDTSLAKVQIQRRHLRLLLSWTADILLEVTFISSTAHRCSTSGCCLRSQFGHSILSLTLIKQHCPCELRSWREGFIIRDQGAAKRFACGFRV